MVRMWRMTYTLRGQQYSNLVTEGERIILSQSLRKSYPTLNIQIEEV